MWRFITRTKRVLQTAGDKLEKCKEHMLSGDKIVQSERGGYYIVKNSGKYYRIGPTGTRSEVKKVYR